MSLGNIIAALGTEIAALQRARAVLAGAARIRRKKRNLTPEGRARITAAVKRRWAAQKKATA